VHIRNRGRSPQGVFTTVYKNQEWGGGSEDYYSGSGSIEPIARHYADAVLRFVREHDIRSIIDLGCGDFRVGSQLCTDDARYMGIDVVPNLIARNQARYQRNNVSFACLDIVADELPPAELCLLRQVFQHLSNRQILAVIRKLYQYRFVLVTEHYPAPGIRGLIPNKDKVMGSDTRILDDSAVFLDRTPFNLKPKRLLLDIEVPNWLVRPGERFKTFVFEFAVVDPPDGVRAR